MGYLDSQTVFCEAQAVTATGDNGSTNTLNLGGVGQGDSGQTGENLWVQAICSTAVTSAGSATVQAVLQSAPDGSTWTDAVAGPALPKASLVAGTVMLQVQPPPGMQQYWRISWRIGTAVLTAGAFDAFVSNTIERNVMQPSGFVAL